MEFVKCDYKIGMKIAGRGNSKCYVATKDDKKYVLKAIEITKDQDDKRKKIKNEIKILKKLKHENVIRLVESFVCKVGNREIHCIVTEYMKMNLSHYLWQKRGKISEKSCKRIMRNLLKGIEYMHQKLVVHQDLKLENVCIDEDDNIKIIDFGMSTICQNEKTIKKLTNVSGTPFYVSPEKFAFEKYDGRKSDAWSCGVICYKLLTNKFPFDPENGSLSELSEMIREDDFEMPKGISLTLQHLLKNLLCKDPSERFNTTEALNHPWFNHLKPTNKKLCKSAMLPLSANDTLELSDIDLTRSIQLIL